MSLRQCFELSSLFLLALTFSCTDDPQQTPDTGPDFTFSTPDLSPGDLNEKKDLKENNGKGDDISNNDISANCNCENEEICVLDLCVPDLNKNTLQRQNLADTPQSERFALPSDRMWPADTNSPQIALWYDDNFAALSITIDDNPGPDFDWWLETSDQFGFKVTWCVISENVENGNAFFGTWADYQRLFERGHALCSHGNIDDEPPAVDAPNAMTWFTDAYKLPIPIIESKVPGARADAIAHPWGKFIRPLVSQYYISGRGVRGGVNKANLIDYMDLRSTSRGIDQNSIDSIMGQVGDGRGWFMAHYHFLQGNLRQQTLSELQYLDQFSDDIWIGRFPDVAKYGQERDTATLTLHSSTEEHQIFSIVDEMDDAKFDFPLTIKTRLPAGWTDVKTTQNNSPTPSRIVTHDGVKYALVDAIPNRGPVLVTPK